MRAFATLASINTELHHLSANQITYSEYMASPWLLQFRAKAAQASKLITKNGSAYYKQLLENNKQYVQDPPTSETCHKLANQLFYTRMASIPHRYEMFRRELNGTKELLKNWRGLNVEQYGLLALFGFECYAWSWLGEIVGRGFTFTGYEV